MDSQGSGEWGAGQEQSRAPHFLLSPPPPSRRITGAGVTFDPMCPAGVSAVRVRGLCYQGNRLDFSFSEGSVTIEVKAQPGPGAPPLEAELWPTHTRVPLLPGGQPAQTHRSIQSR